VAGGPLAAAVVGWRGWVGAAPAPAAGVDEGQPLPMSRSKARVGIGVRRGQSAQITPVLQLARTRGKIGHLFQFPGNLYFINLSADHI
jgi:hypothetical protein